MQEYNSLKFHTNLFKFIDHFVTYLTIFYIEVNVKNYSLFEQNCKDFWSCGYCMMYVIHLLVNKEWYKKVEQMITAKD